MAVWYSLWSFVIFFPIWYAWTKKNLATLDLTKAGQFSYQNIFFIFRKRGSLVRALPLWDFLAYIRKN
jgi:hypothetical protein